ncbi:hypothetical protein BDZ85DRAFT_80631 [Elsinoe ampelina]|uniref:Uncharacterized protein n=1 Tax=Elsinoe ampelina TaxID=302913 RepID=A0A6A6FZE5_9PEZI|nr:hypothetical protein BDZ85DRAFT_80631 [Elsinoe ampelina]
MTQAHLWLHQTLHPHSPPAWESDNQARTGNSNHHHSTPRVNICPSEPARLLVHGMSKKPPIGCPRQSILPAASTQQPWLNFALTVPYCVREQSKPANLVPFFAYWFGGARERVWFGLASVRGYFWGGRGFVRRERYCTRRTLTYSWAGKSLVLGVSWSGQTTWNCYRRCKVMQVYWREGPRWIRWDTIGDGQMINAYCPR